MSHFDEDKLLYTFRTRWEANADLKWLTDEGRVHYHRRPFDPQGLTDPWAFEELFISDETKIATGLIQAVGEVRYTVGVPEASGSEAAATLRKLIAEQFEAGQSLQSADGSLDVTLYRTFRSTSFNETPWDFYPVSILWRTFSTTT